MGFGNIIFEDIGQVDQAQNRDGRSRFRRTLIQGMWLEVVDGFVGKKDRGSFVPLLPFLGK